MNNLGGKEGSDVVRESSAEEDDDEDDQKMPAASSSPAPRRTRSTTAAERLLLLPQPASAPPAAATKNKRKVGTDRNMPAAKRKCRKKMNGTKATVSSSAGRNPLNEEKWNHNFELLRDFHSEHGHCRVPRNFVVESVNLGLWVNKQRSGKWAVITQERFDMLNSVGFDWGPRILDEDAWNQKFELLQEYKNKNGHCRVPKNFEVKSVKLGHWVGKQRGGKRAVITQERFDKLNSVGFVWVGKGQIDEDGWNQKFELLRSFQLKNGHCCVPRNLDIETDKLNQWVINQRRYF